MLWLPCGSSLQCSQWWWISPVLQSPGSPPSFSLHQPQFWTLRKQYCKKQNKNMEHTLKKKELSDNDETWSAVHVLQLLPITSTVYYAEKNLQPSLFLPFVWSILARRHPDFYCVFKDLFQVICRCGEGKVLHKQCPCVLLCGPYVSVSASTGTKLFSTHKEMFQFMTSITFFAVLRAFFAAGLFQFHFLAHDLFTIELQALLQVLLRCKVHIAKFPVELKMQATSDMPPSMNLSVTDQLLFLTLQIKQGRCHASYNDRIL